MLKVWRESEVCGTSLTTPWVKEAVHARARGNLFAFSCVILVSNRAYFNLPGQERNDYCATVSRRWVFPMNFSSLMELMPLFYRRKTAYVPQVTWTTLIFHIFPPTQCQRSLYILTFLTMLTEADGKPNCFSFKVPEKNIFKELNWKNLRSPMSMLWNTITAVGRSLDSLKVRPFILTTFTVTKLTAWYDVTH